MQNMAADMRCFLPHAKARVVLVSGMQILGTAKDDLRDFGENVCEKFVRAADNAARNVRELC